MMEPPRSGSERVIEALESEPDLDEVTRARMEKRLIAAVSSGAHLDVEAERPWQRDAVEATLPSTLVRRRALVAVGTVLAAAAAVALVVRMGDEPPELGSDPDPDHALATFQRYLDGETASRGELPAGGTLETGVSERIEVRIADARVDVTPSSVARFVHLATDRVEVSLVSGAVEVELHPARTGDQTLRVTTERAFVDVVGTVFRVAVDEAGDTHVSTVEGTVRVTPRAGGEPTLVSAGQEVTISVPELAVAEDPLIEERPGPEPSDLSDAVEGGETPAEDSAERPPSVRDLFARAEARLDAGDHAGGRRILEHIATTESQAPRRVRAYTLLAESYASQRDYGAAAEAYGDAVDAGGRSIGAQNALFAMGRLFERQMRDEDAATAAYRQYLELSPGGAHADQIHRALCAMGHEDHCL